MVVAFWSAMLEAEEQCEGEGVRREVGEDLTAVEEGEGMGELGVSEADEMDETREEVVSEDDGERKIGIGGAEARTDEVEMAEGLAEPAQCDTEGECEGKLLSREELIALFRKIGPPHSVITVGMVSVCVCVP